MFDICAGVGAAIQNLGLTQMKAREAREMLKMGINGLEIQEASNGFIVLERARIGTNLYGDGKTHVFRSAEELTTFVKEHFAKQMPADLAELATSAAINGQLRNN